MTKIVGRGTAWVLVALFGIATVLLLLPERLVKEPGPVATPPVSVGQHPAKPTEGTVVANDETVASGPHQTIFQPTLASAATSYYVPKAPSKTTPQYIGKTIVIDNVEYPLRTYKPMMTPNDPLASQWWVTNTHIDQMWDIPHGSQPTTIAMIDTGFALKHEEFTNRWYINSGESGPATSEAASKLNCTDRHLALNASCNLIDDNHDGIVDNESGPTSYQNPSQLNCTDQGKPLTKDCNLIDDDGNGYVDDVTGWDFANGDNSPQAGQLNPNGTGTTHGTMTTGVVAATGNNSKGLAGVDWGAKILPLEALDDDSYGDTWSVGKAIYYAIQQHVDVISISLGSDQPDPYVQQAVQAASQAGIIVVAAAGNGGCNCMVYPANYPEVVAVGAIDTTNHRASFSSWGDNLDVMAPGTNINTSTWTASNPTGSYVTGVAGTSFSTPIVSGVLARLKSAQPNDTPLQLIAAMTENTNRLTIGASTPHDSQLGFGALDALRASQRVSSVYSPVQLYALSPISQGDHLNSSQPADKIGTFSVFDCSSSAIPGTPIYELKNGSDDFFSISPAEADKAASAGYSSSVFSYGCLEQPQDTPINIRNLNILSEFKNVYTH